MPRHRGKPSPIVDQAASSAGGADIDQGLRRKTFAVHGVVLALGVALSALIYFQGHAVLGVTMALVDQDLPTLQSLSDFKTAVAAEEPILYEYYATADRAQFLRRFQDNQAEVERGLQFVREAFPRSTQLAAIEEKRELTRSFAAQLDDTLKADTIDWDKARLLLSLISRYAAEINGNVDFLAQSTQQGVFARGGDVSNRLDGMVGLVMSFSVALFLVALFIGHYANAYIAEARARKRLAMFPERNPNPVLRLTREGEVVYANPSARTMLERIGADPAVPAALFPGDLSHKLGVLQTAGQENANWEYAVHGRTLSCEIHLLKDFEVFHAYLADITERKRAEQQLVHQAFHDPLTGLPNWQRFQQRVEEALSRSGGQGSFAVLLLNLDRFRLIIDSLGHTMGRQVLQAAAVRLGEALDDCREEALCAAGGLYRFEGDSFGILAPGIDSQQAATRLAARIAASEQAPLKVDAREFFVTFSIGAALHPDHGTDAVSLLKNADSALQRVKQRGGNGVQCYDSEMNARALELLELENALRHAEARGELDVFYQPQVELATGCIGGMEALARWRHPQRGLVNPADFIPLAEESGLIVPIGAWVLRTACAQNKAWQDAGLPRLTVAVNLSARQFLDPELPQAVQAVLAETGLEPAYLELEVTESIAMHDVATTIRTLDALRQAGIRCSIDDFGTGYSSLSYLKRLPLDKLKVDQSFVRDMDGDADAAAITRAIVDLGHSLGIRVIAEGVENPRQRELLTGYGCDEAQGYLFGRPLPAVDFARLVQDWGFP
ncbi:MAG: bifunctional diguanylate cyclase/phosphodiesterase [Thiobacillus sp.]|nr:bifunctional diguanylate cyclase/phosphodiesterase [Thiobacillus sp.]